MRVRQLTIKNFRGIRELEWDSIGDMVCLIGPGDSCKSTILLALEYLFSPSWTLPVSDIDFYQMNVQTPIEITALVTQLPDVLISEDKFGLCLGFWNPKDSTLHKKQTEDCYQLTLQIKLEIAKDWEPKWSIVSLQGDDDRSQPISAADRRLLGVAKIGNYVDADLAWGRTSALTRLTEKDDISRIPGMLAEAERKLLKELESTDFNSFTQAIAGVAQEARAMGIDAQNAFCAGLDPTRVSLRQGAIALFDGILPLSLRGAGSRRLMVMAIHKASVKEGAVILVDEIEHSLEPYRLRHLIRHLCPQEDDRHQLIFTTHSSVSVVECTAQQLYVVHSENGKTTVCRISDDLQKVARTVPESFLARRVIVCEGKTEAGLCRGLDIGYWQSRRGPLAAAGVVPIESAKSGGSEAPQYAVGLAKLGYQVIYFGDSDNEEALNPSVNEMLCAGSKVLLWPKEDAKGLATEERLSMDLPIDGLLKLIELAIELEIADRKPGKNVWRDIHAAINLLSGRTNDRIDNLETLIGESGEMTVRTAIGCAAKKHEWFKRMDKGQKLGELLSCYLDAMSSTPTGKSLKELESWCYG